MKYLLSIAALAGAAVAQMTEIVAPGGPPAGCQTTDPNTFQIQTVNVTSSGKVKRQAPGDPSAGAAQLIISLTDGKLTDAKGRTGYIASNRQFQFDFANGQAGTVYNAGWSVCGNNSLALGGSTIFYQCLSGDFYNLYDQSTGDQCSPIYIVTIPSGSNPAGAGGSAPAPAPAPSTPSAAAPAPAQPTQIPDGQVQAPPAASQIPDGQVQAGNSSYSAPVPQYTGAAAALAPGMGALAAGAIAFALL